MGTQAYALVISDRMLKSKSDGSKMSVLFSRYYSFANIREGNNNSFKCSVDDGKTWTTIHLPT